MRAVFLPGVFRPRSDTRLLARVARAVPLQPGARVLELCAGPAIAGVTAARGRALLTTVDVSRRAVFNAWLNARLNGVEVSARRGDLWEAVAGERFDLVLANPPYVPGPPPPERGAARAWDAGDDGRALLDRICSGVAAHLRPGGIVLLVHSELVGREATLGTLAEYGLGADVAACEHGPLGPLVSARRGELEARGILRPGQSSEDVFVLRGRAPTRRPTRWAIPTP
ncbi:MAG TPA: HemK2/MTQ2 family protein methyltransferase [Solirubrobacter sp.]|nr:HemK2/MTQ2 family protein methyltransferase [Solirubrobacter sp.]